MLVKLAPKSTPEPSLNTSSCIFAKLESLVVDSFIKAPFTFKAGKIRACVANGIITKKTNRFLTFSLVVLSSFFCFKFRKIPSFLKDSTAVTIRQRDNTLSGILTTNSPRMQQIIFELI